MKARLARALLALTLAAAAGALIVALAAPRPADAAAAFVRGAMGDGHAIAESITLATPLLLAGLAVSLAFRAGVLNIGAEGQILGGTALSVAVGLHVTALPAPLAMGAVLAAACAGGAATAAVAAALKRGRGVPEVLSTILLNFIAAQMVSWLVRGPLQEAAHGYPQSDRIAENAMLPRLLPPTSLHAGTLAAALVAAALAFLLFRTSWGFRARACGLSPEAARFAGFAPARVAATALVASGALAGLAGGVQVAGLTGRLYDNAAGGAGYVAIAVALLGRLHPAGVVAASLLFGALEAGAAQMQREAGVSAALAQVVEATALAAVLAADFAARARTSETEPPPTLAQGAAP